MKRIKHTKRQWIVLCLLGGWFAVALALFGWFAWQNTAYRQQAVVYATKIAQQVDTTQQTFNKLHTTSDTAGIGKALSDAAAVFLASAGQSPQAPSIAGLKLGTENNERNQQQIAQYCRAYAVSLQKAATYLNYQQQITAQLQQLTLIGSTNQQQLTNMATQWRAFGEALAALTPPAGAEVAHAQLRQKTDQVVAIITQLPELYKKIDIAGFSAKQKELNAAIESLRPVGVQFSAIAAAHDNELAANLAALKKIL